MGKILFCIILYAFISNVSTYAAEFELSDIIKQAREAEKTRIIQENNKIQEQKSKESNEKNISEQITNSAVNNDNKKGEQ